MRSERTPWDGVTVPGSAATLVTQTRVRAESSDAFERWVRRMSAAVAGFPGYLGDDIIAPSPPIQVDWVMVQRFASVGTARAWLQSNERQALLAEAQPLLAGPLELHLFTGQTPRVAAVSAIITTRVKPGKLDAFLGWQRQISVLQAKYEGFQGYKLEPPIAGVQDEWTIVLRFDSDAHIDAWLASNDRQEVLKEATVFDADTRIRKVRSGFDFWFTQSDALASQPPSWKQNLLVLVVLYPLVFLFGEWVQEPLLLDRGVPFWLALFIGNVVTVALLGWVLLPTANRLFASWLNLPVDRHPRAEWTGTAWLVLLCGLSLFVFARFF
jgi:antibiotic biosynthesis monooxygenase (ABM) superfamily enzyme